MELGGGPALLPAEGGRGPPRAGGLDVRAARGDDQRRRSRARSRIPSVGDRVIISFVIPALNEGGRLPGFLDAIGRHLAGSGREDAAIEIIVVDDGSRPDHLQMHRDAVSRLAGALVGRPHRAILYELATNRGKGEAIRRGWARSSSDAEWVGFVDADGAVPASELMRLTGMLASCGECDVLAGSRIRMAGRTIERSPFRHLQGR